MCEFMDLIRIVLTLALTAFWALGVIFGTLAILWYGFDLIMDSDKGHENMRILINYISKKFQGKKKD